MTPASCDDACLRAGQRPGTCRSRPWRLCHTLVGPEPCRRPRAPTQLPGAYQGGTDPGVGQRASLRPGLTGTPGPRPHGPRCSGGTPAGKCPEPGYLGPCPAGSTPAQRPRPWGCPEAGGQGCDCRPRALSGQKAPFPLEKHKERQGHGRMTGRPTTKAAPTEQTCLLP